MKKPRGGEPIGPAFVPTAVFAEDFSRLIPRLKRRPRTVLVRGIVTTLH